MITGSRCSVVAEQQAGSREDPLGWVGVLALHVQVGLEDVGGTSQGGVVHGTVVLTQDLLLLQLHGHHVHDRQSRVQFLWSLLDQVAFLPRSSVFPSCTFQDETVDEGSRLGVCLYFLR